MKKNILKILFVLFLILTPIILINYNTLMGCSNKNYPIEKVDTLLIDTIENVYGLSMRNMYERVYTPYQFDSICKADHISKDLNKWHIFASRDGETGEPFQEYMYILSSRDKEIIYRLIKTNNGNYKITKRITVR